MENLHNLSLPVGSLINNLTPNDTLIKVFNDLDHAVRLHEAGILVQPDILMLKMWRMVFEEYLAGEGYDFILKEFVG